MKLLKLPVKIILAPIVLAMTGIVFVLALMMAVSTRLLAIASSLLGTFALLVFITGDAKNGGMVLLLAFLVSPYGLPNGCGVASTTCAAGCGDSYSVKTIRDTVRHKCRTVFSLISNTSVAKQEVLYGHNAHHPHARQQGKDHRAVSESADGLCQESG